MVTRLRTLPSGLYRKYRTVRVRLAALRKIVHKERSWKVPWRLRQPKWWRRGFLSRSAVLYELDHNDPDLYVTDVHRYFQTKQMVHPKIQDIINNKLTTHLLLRSMDVPSAQLLGVFLRGQVHFFPQEGRLSLAAYLRDLPAGEAIFVKAVAGAEGKNVFSVIRTGGREWAINGTAYDESAAVALLGREDFPFIIERGLAQHLDTEALYPNSVNTLRVLTMIDVEAGGDPFIAAAVQRIGCRRSEPADNWTRGGLSAPVDLDTGALGRATRLPDWDVKEWFDDHPDTGAPIVGQVVPYWPRVFDLVLHASRVLSFMEYVGWDIVVTPQGPVVLEANINSGLNVLQSHRPLMADARVRAYYAERGVRTGADQR